MIARYTRNLAHISSDLVANVYDLAVGARSIVDDNYGWEVWQMANRYLAQHDTSELETVRLSAGEISYDQPANGRRDRSSADHGSRITGRSRA